MSRSICRPGPRSPATAAAGGIEPSEALRLAGALARAALGAGLEAADLAGCMRGRPIEACRRTQALATSPSWRRRIRRAILARVREDLRRYAAVVLARAHWAHGGAREVAQWAALLMGPEGIPCPLMSGPACGWQAHGLAAHIRLGRGALIVPYGRAVGVAGQEVPAGSIGAEVRGLVLALDAARLGALQWPAQTLRAATIRQGPCGWALATMPDQVAAAPEDRSALGRILGDSGMPPCPGRAIE